MLVRCKVSSLQVSQAVQDKGPGRDEKIRHFMQKYAPRSLPLSPVMAEHVENVLGSVWIRCRGRQGRALGRGNDYMSNDE